MVTYGFVAQSVLHQPLTFHHGATLESSAAVAVNRFLLNYGPSVIQRRRNCLSGTLKDNFIGAPPQVVPGKLAGLTQGVFKVIDAA